MMQNKGKHTDKQIAQASLTIQAAWREFQPIGKALQKQGKSNRFIFDTWLRFAKHYKQKQ